MGQTVDQLEAHIDRTRDQLGSNIHELKRRVDAATDWRQQFCLRPFAFLGAAIVGGAVAAAILRRTHPPRAFTAETPGVSLPSSKTVPSQRIRGFDVWDNVKMAAITLAASRLKEYVDQLLPGFDEHYERAERGVDM
jgi:hypothetical protein